MLMRAHCLYFFLSFLKLRCIANDTGFKYLFSTCSVTHFCKKKKKAQLISNVKENMP